MKNIEIKVSRETRMVFLEKNIIGNDGENLQEKLVFSFKDEFVDGQARLEYEIDGEKYFAILTKVGESYEIPIKNVITKEFQINMQLVITEGTNDNEIPVFKSNVFYVFVNKSINAESEEPDGYTQWLDIANTKLNTIDESINYANERGEYANKQGNYAKEQGMNAKNVADDTQKKANEGLFNGKSLQFIWDGTKLGIRLEGESEYQFVNLQGIQGIKGDTGEPFKIKKTYPSINEMKADFKNMLFGDYVMIANSVEMEDNAKLYTRGEFEWIFITDFSGAMGIRGETGLTPNIQIGAVQTLEPEQQATVTRSGTNENPIFNFAIPMGKKGDNYEVTNEDLEKIATNITENANSKFNQNVDSQIENFNKIVDEGIEDYNKNANDLITAVDILTPKQNASGVPIYVDDALPYKVFNYGTKGNYKQETTTGIQEFNANAITNTDIMISDKGQKITFPIVTSGNGYVKTNETLGELCPNLVVGDTVYLYFDRNLGTSYNNRIYLRGSSIFWSNGTSHTITSEDLATEINMYGNNYDSGEIEQCILTNFLITKTPNATYEPYTNGASPNPDYPQEIEIIEGDVSYRSLGKNKFETGDLVESTIYGITFTPVYNENNLLEYINVNGTATGNAYYNFPKKVTLPMGNYVLSGCPTGGNASSTFTLSLGDIRDYGNKKEFMLEEDTTLGTSYIVVFKGYVANNLKFYPMVGSVSEVDDTYEPFQETKTPIDLKGNFVGKLPNGVVDRLLYKDRHIYLEKNVKKVVLDGSDDERWTYYSANDEWARPYVLINDKKIAQSLYDYDTLSNKFIPSNWMSCYLGNFNKYAVFSYNADKRICFLIKKEDLISLDTAGVKDYFSKNQTETYYPLESPELIDLGEYDLSTLQGTNNINLLANIEPSEMNITYALDIKKYIDKKVQ